MKKLTIEVSSVKTTEPTQHFAANERVRSCNVPSVFMTTQRLPCIASARSDAAPTSSVYQSIIPAGLPGTRVVHNGKKKYPSESSGTPRTTLPSATPKTTASIALATANPEAHSRCPSGVLLL